MKEWHDIETGTVYTEDDMEDLLDTICDPEYYEDRDSFDEWLDDGNDGAEVCGRQFSASEILYACNEDAYFDELREWAENEATYNRDDIAPELERMDDGEVQWFNNVHIRCVETEDEEEEEETEEPTKPAEQKINVKPKQIEWENLFEF